MSHTPVYPEEKFVRPHPVTPTADQSTRAAQANYDGGSFWMIRPMTFNRIIWKITFKNQTPIGRIGIYQAARGLYDQSVPKIASILSYVPAVQTFIVAPDEGTVEIEAGLFFVLWGKNTGNHDMRTYAANAIDLYNQSVPSVTEKYMGNFTTDLSAGSTLPASFDPRTLAQGGNCTPTTSDTAPVIALAKV